VPDVDTEDYEVDADEEAASQGMEARRPTVAQDLYAGRGMAALRTTCWDIAPMNDPLDDNRKDPAAYCIAFMVRPARQRTGY